MAFLRMGEGVGREVSAAPVKLGPSRPEHTPPAHTGREMIPVVLSLYIWGQFLRQKWRSESLPAWRFHEHLS